MATHDLQLRKNGILVTKEWDNGIKDYVERTIDAQDFIFHVGDSVCLDKGVTLRDLFMLINKNIELWSVIASCPFLDELIQVATEPFKKDNDMRDIIFLELCWKVYVYSNEESTFISENTDFHGIGLDETYAIEFSPLNELAPLPLIINEEYIIYNKDKKLLSVCKTFSLGDLIKEIILELSFIGTPDMKEAVVEDLKRRVDEIKTGEAKFTSWEDFQKKSQIEDEKNKKPCKFCGNDSRSPIFNKPPDVCVKCFKKMREN